MSDELAHGSNSTIDSIIVPSGAESVAYGTRTLGEVYKSADRVLDFRCVEVVDKVLGRKRIRTQFSDIVFIPHRDIIQQALNFRCAEVVSGHANAIGALRVAVDCLVITVSRTVEGVVHLRFDGFVERTVVVRVSGKDGEVVVGLILD